MGDSSPLCSTTYTTRRECSVDLSGGWVVVVVGVGVGTGGGWGVTIAKLHKEKKKGKNGLDW